MLIQNQVFSYFQITAFQQKRNVENLKRNSNEKKIRRFQNREKIFTLRMHRKAHRMLKINNKMNVKDLKIIKIQTFVRISDYFFKFVNMKTFCEKHAQIVNIS